MKQSALYRKFKNSFVGPILTRKQLKTLLANQPQNIPPIPERKEPVKVYIADTTRPTRMIKQSIATPKWADKKAIKRIYDESKEITKNTGIKHHVDHIVPLRHPLVCGLHVAHNLQIITEQENLRKSNDHQI